MSEFLTITPGEVSTKDLHAHLLGAVAPRPIGFVSTINKEGIANLAPFSFFNVFSSKPPTLIFSPARRVRDNTTKHTLENLYAIPECVINVVNYPIVDQMNLASSEYPAGVNEFLKAGFSAAPSMHISAPRVLESPVQIETKVVEIKPLSNQGGGGNLIICRVLCMHINKNILGPDGSIDPNLIDLVGRMGGNYYSRASGAAVFEVEKPLTSPGIGIDLLPAFIRNSSILTGNDLGKLGNMETLPSVEALISFEAKEKNGLLKGITGEEAFHRKAQELLAEGRKNEAIALLMVGGK